MEVDQRPGAPRSGPAICAREVSKSFVVRKGVPTDSNMGEGHWVISQVLRLRHPAERYQALAGVSLDVGQGEFFGLLGPNGAGKTTFLKCLSTLLTPDSGVIQVNGFDARVNPFGVRTSITMVGSGQWVAFDWGLTVQENLRFFADLYGLPTRLVRTRIDDALETVGLAHKRTATPRTLSAGERQRLVLAKGFLLRTPILLLDEPTANLDPRSTWDVQSFIRNQLSALQGVTVIYTTHRMEEAESLCDRVAIMDKGQILASGTPQELIAMAAMHHHIQIEYSGLAGELSRRIAEVEGVHGSEFVPKATNETGGFLRVQCDDAERCSRDLLRLMTSLSLTIVDLRSSKPRLGDAFIQLTGRGVRNAV